MRTAVWQCTLLAAVFLFVTTELGWTEVKPGDTVTKLTLRDKGEKGVNLPV